MDDIMKVGVNQDNLIGIKTVLEKFVIVSRGLKSRLCCWVFDYTLVNHVFVWFGEQDVAL